MKPQAHTPGSWFAVRDSLAGEDGLVLYDEKRGRVLAHIFVGDAERVANATLIVAAPDLLAELTDSTDLLNALLGAMPPALQKKWPSIVRRSLTRIESSRAAIAKARGE